MIGQSYFPTNFMMTGNPIATLPLNPNSANYGTTVGMQSLLQSLYSSTYNFEAAAYNQNINNSPYSSFLDAPANYQPQFPSYSPFGLNSDPYFSHMGSGQGGFNQMGETNPFFNAGFSGALGSFFGGSSPYESQSQAGSWSMTGQTGCNGQPSSIDFTWTAAPQSCTPPPCESNSCSQFQAPGSLAGSMVYGDPHITDANGGHQDFTSPNGLFINANGSAVLTQADASNKETTSVQAYAPGQDWSIDADPTQTQVYEQVDGCMKDIGTAASLGIGYNACNTGTNVAANSSVYLGDNVNVSWDPSDSQLGSTVRFNTEQSVA